ncbi:hypothetical protein VPNG_03042 [Cytospora leucostoma]|uniref:SnoaL-like domain-containing protein n=1 Tax=Cytospora leucostoma TaxID=1230097 RepID=A0A423XGE2_9PEZI|nr:hypothetical protein VPNG_03042 [Cytospora leucostoma]
MSNKPTRREIAIEVIEAYRSWDIERIMAYRTDDCTQEVIPKSLKQTPQDNATYRKYFASIVPLFQDFQPTIHEIVEDERENKAFIWVSSKGETVIGPYGNEYTILLYFNDAGDKVEKIVEFVDSAYTKEFFTRLAKHTAKRA